MRKIILFVSMLFSFYVANTQNEKPYKATVEKIDGIPVFIFSIPAGDYEIVGKGVTTGNIIKLMVDETSTVKEKTVNLVKKAVSRRENGKVPEFDALIIDLEKEKVLAIKFKDNASETGAKVKESETVPVFFFSAPVDDYKVVASLPADYSARAQRGMLLDKVESMMRRDLKKKENGEVDDFDAVIINPEDLSQKLIKFK